MISDYCRPWTLSTPVALQALLAFEEGVRVLLKGLKVVLAFESMKLVIILHMIFMISLNLLREIISLRLILKLPILYFCTSVSITSSVLIFGLRNNIV